MANINVTWTDPATQSDIDNICVHRFDTDQSSTYANGALTAAESTAILGNTDSPIKNASDSTYTYQTAGGSKTFVDSDVASGSYTYAVFSKNAGGAGPGSAFTLTF